MKATVYSKDPCPFCVYGKDLLLKNNYEITEFVVDVDLTKSDMQSIVEQKTGTIPQTVPQIFIGDEYIGGFTELQAWFDSKEQGSIDLSGFSI